MGGRILITFLLATAVIAGALMYYLQVYAYYEELDPGQAEVRLTQAATGEAVTVEPGNFRGIDSDSSPIRYRACFDLALTAEDLAAFETVEGAEPRIAPGWFDCFDAAALGADIENGAATVYMGQRDVTYGIDRVVAVYPDGRAYSWHEINACGEVVFDGDPVPEECPEPPESLGG